MSATLAQKLEPSFVGFDELKDRYRPMLAVVKELIGVVPNCDKALEMWRPGFRTYNLLVPNTLNLPLSLLGRGAPKDLQGLAMYTSSRAADCAYCSAHTCSYALRRGSSTDAVTGKYSETENAVVRLAEGMARIPSDLTGEDCASALSLLEPHEVEEIALSVSLMGFLNKFMDAMGIELEPEAIEDVSSLIGPTGWSAGQHTWEPDDAEPVIDLRDRPPVDDIKTYARVLGQRPSAIMLERSWTKGVPTSGSKAVAYVQETTGITVGILEHIRRGPMVRALATVVRDNLDPTISAVGLRAKSLAGWIYAQHVANPELIEQAGVLLDRYHPDLSPAQRTALASLPSTESPTLDRLDNLNERDRAAVRLALAVSPSPASVDADLVESVSADLTPAEIVELVVWISVQQAMHRYRLFVDARQASGLV